MPDWLWASPIIVVALAWFGWGAGSHQLHGDEFASWHAATLNWDDLARLVSHRDVVQAPYYAFLHAWVAMFGDSVLALRIPSVIALAAAVYLLTVLGARIVGRAAGVLAGLCMLLIPSMTDIAQYARGYAFTLCLAVAATFAFVVACRSTSSWRWPRYGILVVLLGAAHLLALTLVVAHGLTLLRRGVAPAARRGFLITAGCVAVLFVPVVLVSHAQAPLMLGWITVTWDTIRTYPYVLVHSIPLLAIVASAAGMGVLDLARQPNRPALALLLSWAAAPPVMLALLTPVTPVLYYLYLEFTVPAIALLAGAGTVAAGRALLPRRREWAWGAAALVLLLVVVASWGDHAWARRDVRADRPDYAGAAAAILSRATSADVIVFSDKGSATRTPFDYVARDAHDRPRDALVQRSAAATGWFTATECTEPAACLGTPSRVWVMSSPANGDPLRTLAPELRTVLGTDYRIAWQQKFTGAVVTEFAR